MGESEQQSGDELLACCGHSRRMHTPRCRHWTPGTRLEAPHACACLGAPDTLTPEMTNAAGSGVENLSLT
jgi:hypothetical protein